MRLTAQRKAILDELARAKTHPTADEVFKAVRRKLPRISLGTVYRNLEQLSARGVINRIDSAGGPMRFDADTEGHYHVRCVGCHKLEDIDIGHLPAIAAIEEKLTGYRILGHRLEFFGLCRKCRNTKARS